MMTTRFKQAGQRVLAHPIQRPALCPTGAAAVGANADARARLHVAAAKVEELLTALRGARQELADALEEAADQDATAKSRGAMPVSFSMRMASSRDGVRCPESNSDMNGSEMPS